MRMGLQEISRGTEMSDLCTAGSMLFVEVKHLSALNQSGPACAELRNGTRSQVAVPFRT